MKTRIPRGRLVANFAGVIHVAFRAIWRDTHGGLPVEATKKALGGIYGLHPRVISPTKAIVGLRVRRGCWAVRIVALVLFLLVVGCRCNRHESVSRDGSRARSASSSTPTTEPAGGAAHTPQQLTFVVNEAGILLHDKPVVIAPEVRETLRGLVPREDIFLKNIAIRASRSARTTIVRDLMEAAGGQGAALIDVHTPSSRPAAPATVKFFPRSMVPKHEGRCAVQFELNAKSEASMLFIPKSKPAPLPQSSSGPDLTAALTELHQRMAGCESTLFILAGEENSIWGPVFDLARTVSTSPTGGVPRYIMVGSIL